MKRQALNVLEKYYIYETTKWGVHMNKIYEIQLNPISDVVHNHKNKTGQHIYSVPIKAGDNHNSSQYTKSSTAKYIYEPRKSCGAHRGESVDVVLGCDAMWTCR
jgi:hypothetical protein